MSQPYKTILVAGGAGFIGSHLCNALLDRGCKVICMDNLYTGRQQNIQPLLKNPNFSFVEHNIIDEIFIEEPIDQIYNLACPASPPHYQKDPLFTLRTSVWGTWNLLQLAKAKGARLLHASTSEVYGDPLEHPQSETYWGHVNPIGVRSNYDEGKRCAETMIMDFHRQEGLEVKIIRIFNTYGPNMDPKDGRVVSNFIVQALENKDLTVYGDGSQTRSFQFVSDLVSGILKTMDSPAEFLGPVNLGNPHEFTIIELARQVLELLPESKSRIQFLSLPQDDPKQRKPNISLAKTTLQWEPVVQLREGLISTIKYFKSVI